MNHFEIVNFLATNHLLSFGEMVEDEFALEFRKESFQIYFINRANNNENQKKYVLKIALGNSALEQFFLRKEHFIVKYLAKNEDDSLYFDFDNQSEKYFPNKNPTGLYRDDTVLVRHFFSNIDNNQKIRDFSQFIKSNPSIDKLKEVIQAIASHLKQIHAINIAELEEESLSRFSSDEIYQFPWAINATKLAKKTETGYQTLFWNKIITPQEINLIIKNLKSSLNQGFVHGDLSPKNILIFERDNSVEVKFIDWEMWHIGERSFDIVLLFEHLKKHFPTTTISSLHQHFMLNYENDYKDNSFNQQAFESVAFLSDINTSYQQIVEAKSENEILQSLANADSRKDIFYKKTDFNK